jgi:hypothetical protein
VAKIATGEEPEDYGADDGQDPAAKSLGSRGGKARAERLTSLQRKRIAMKAAKARWATTSAVRKKEAT